MNTWTCKRVIILLIGALSLAGCGEDAPGLGFATFSPLGASKEGAKPRPDVSLPRAELGNGALALVPPDGFCVDKRSLENNFATLSRCDSLGGEGGAFEAPLGLVLVSVVRLSGTPDVARLLPDAFGPDVQVLERFGEGDRAFAHLLGGAPKDVDPVYWRAMARINGHLISYSAYAPEGGDLATAEGGRVLQSLVSRMANGSEGLERVDTAASEELAPRGGLRGRIGGLFNRKAFIE